MGAILINIVVWSILMLISLFLENDMAFWGTAIISNVYIAAMFIK